MKKTLYKLLCGLLAALTLTGVSLAATPEDAPQGRNFPPDSTDTDGDMPEGAAPKDRNFPPEFTDMDSDDVPASVRNAVRKAQLKGAVAGYSDGSFRPLDGVTRRAFSKMSMEFLNETDRSLNVSLTDVKPNDSCYAYVATMVRKGYMTGYTDTFFGASDPLTRQQECAVIGRVLNLKSMTEEKIATQLGKYKDGNQITIDDARACVAFLTENKVIEPDAKGNFNPTHNMNRGETIELLCALLDIPVQS